MTMLRPMAEKQLLDGIPNRVLFGIMGVGAGLFALGLTASYFDQRRKAADAAVYAQAARAEELEQEKREAKEKEQKAAAKKQQLASTDEPRPLQPWVGVIAKLGPDPVGQKARLMPSGGEPHRTYEASVVGLGTVTVWVFGPGRWEVFIPKESKTVVVADDLAPPRGLQQLDQLGLAQHWKIDDGPLAGTFLMSSPGGYSVRSRAAACTGSYDMTPLVGKACR
jgi:hypothetical protein